MRLLSARALLAPRRTLAIASVFTVVAAVVGAGTPSRLSDSQADLDSHGTQSFRTAQLLKATMGPRAFPELGVLAPAEGKDNAHVLAELQKVANVVPKLFYSRNKRTVLLLGYFHRNISPAAATANLVERLKPFPGVLVTGRTLVGEEFRTRVKHDLIRAELIALPLLLLLTLVIFRSVVSALLPVLVGGLTLVTALFGLRLINAVYPISILSLNLVSGAAMALAVDYSLLLVSRYREELRHGLLTIDATRAMVATAGRTVTLSAATVAAAFASLLVFPQDFLRSVAIGGMLVSTTAALVSMTVLPALLSLLGHNVNALAPKRWQRSMERTARPEIQGFWYRLARFVMKRPAAIAALSMTLLVALGAPALGMRLTGLDVTSLPASAHTRSFEERVKTEFAHSLFGEVLVVAHGNSHTIRSIVARYFTKLPNVEAGLARRVATNLWELNLKPVGAPFAPDTENLVRHILALPPKFQVTGVTASYLDTAASLKARLPLALTLLLSTTLIFLYIATGSIILPVKTVLMNVLSLAAAFGLLVWIFQDGRLESLLGYRSQGAIALTQPILIGASTFGILTDYGIFLLTRIREGWDSGLSNRDAVALGVERTGRIISAAALLFCVAVGALVTSRITVVKEIGIGFAVAVALDAFLVRALLVPSLMIILGRWNWWHPRMPLGHRRERIKGQGRVTGVLTTVTKQSTPTSCAASHGRAATGAAPTIRGELVPGHGPDRGGERSPPGDQATMGSNSTAMLARSGASEQVTDLGTRARDLTAVRPADCERTPRVRGHRTLLSVESVHTSYDGVKALCDVHLTVERGEILAILGLNGAGKTTLMSVIAGLQRPDSGRVLLDGIERKVGSKAGKRPVGLAPQTTGVYPTLSVRDNLRFFGELSGLKRRELDAQISATAEALDLVHLLHRKARHLSGGEARRLHVGMVMICRPPILLLDEPTVGMDVASRALFIDFVKDVAADGTAICYSTHYLSEVEQLGASVAILDKGSVIAHEGVDRLIARRGTSLVELRFEGPPPHLPVDGARVHRDETSLRIEIDGAPAEEAARIVGTLGDAGRHLRAIVLIQPSLESVFVELTGRAFVDTSHT